MCFVTFVLKASVLIGAANSLSVLPKAITGQECGIEASSNLAHHNPWLVFLEYYRHDHLTEIRCGGTLIDKRHIITAAHCVEKPKYSRLEVRLGEYDVASKRDCIGDVCTNPIVRIDVEQKFVHPEYDGIGHDIAILKLKEDVTFTDFIRPICLPTGELEDKAILSAAGWGEIPFMGVYSNVKKIVPLPVWHKDRCQAVYANTKLPDHVLCAGGEEGKDTCRGDSGGPLTFARDRVELWGVTSLGNVNCGTKGSPGIYTNVKYYTDWINAVVNKV